jgi:hypothetical protein
MQYSASGEPDSSLANQQTRHALQTQWFTVFAVACHMSLSWARSVHSISVILLFGDQLQCYSPFYGWFFQVLPMLHLCVSYFVMLLCTAALDCLWEPLWLLGFIVSEFCFIWICDEVFVKWSVLWSKVLLQFDMSAYGLVKVGWDSYKICLFCAVDIEGVLCDLCVSWCDVIIVVRELYSTCNYSGYCVMLIHILHCWIVLLCSTCTIWS